MARATLIRLASFVLVIAGTFGTAYGVGRKLPGNPESKPHTHGPVQASPAPPGFEVDGYVLVNDQSHSSASATTFYIKAPDGQRVTDFTESHGSKLHAVLIRFDLSGFEHLHPDINTDGSFAVPTDQPGKWHIVIDSQPAGPGAPIVLSTNIDDEVPVDEVALPKPSDTVTVDDLVIARNGLHFTVTSKDGSSPDGLEPYIGQPAHLIAIRQGDLAYTHLHPVASPEGSTFAFDGSLPAGTYRLFLQFGHSGDVVTAGFTVVQP
jgi:hypothetical protein